MGLKAGSRLGDLGGREALASEKSLVESFLPLGLVCRRRVGPSRGEVGLQERKDLNSSDERRGKFRNAQKSADFLEAVNA